MTINEYQKEVLSNIVKYSDKKNPLLTCATGLKLESEANYDLIRRNSLSNCKFDINKFAKTLGYIAWYIAISSDIIGYDLETILQMNIDDIKPKTNNMQYLN